MGSRKKHKTHKRVRNNPSLNTEESSEDEKIQQNRSGKAESKEDFSGVTIFNSPILSVRTLIRVLVYALKTCFDFVVKHWLAFLVAVVAIFVFVSVPLPDNLE